MRKPKTPPQEEVSFQAGFANLRRAVEDRFARMPPRDEVLAPEPVRMETAAERELFRAEMTYRLQALLCRDPGRCAKHRCRRLSRCQELADLAPLVEEQRALVAKERAAAVAAAADAGAQVAEVDRDGRRGARARRSPRQLPAARNDLASAERRRLQARRVRADGF